MPTLCWRWFSGKFRSIDDPLELDFFHFLILDSFSLTFNHSCDPNLESRILKGHILYVSIRPIRKGEELTVDYLFGPDEEKVACKCGAKRCRGTINLPE